LASLGWPVTIIKLALKLRFEISRVQGKSPQQLQLAEAQA
jgi:hypothetical protein